MKFQPGHTFGFKPGQSGNPSGRPKMTPEMRAAKDAARKATPEMVAGLIATTRDESIAPELRHKARMDVLRVAGFEEAVEAVEEAFSGAAEVPTEQLYAEAEA